MKVLDLIKKTFKLMPYKHQLFGIKFALEKKWSINSYVMGMGKSCIAIAITIITKDKTLIVCPAFLKLNWEKEYNKFLKKPLKIKVLFSKDLKTFVPSDEEVIIVNYDILDRTRSLFKWANFVCFDESHYLGNPKSIRTKAAYTFCLDYLPEYLLLLSGSPIRGKVPQYYAPLKLVGENPKKTSGHRVFDTYYQFQERFCHSRLVDVGPRTIKKFYGVKNEKGLRNLLRDKFLRRCPDYEVKLPPITFENIPVDYSIAEDDLLKLFEEHSLGAVLSDHLSSAKKSNALSKVPFTYKFTENIITSGEGPVAVYSDHPQVLDDLAKLFKKKKITCSIIDGSTDVVKRQQYVDDFQAGEIDVFLATIGAASTGITITKANKFIFNDKNWINTENDQALKRIHRLTQTKACIIYSVISGEVDEKIQRVIKSKDVVMKKTVDFVE